MNGYIKVNPVTKVRRLNEGQQRQRVMSFDEERRIREGMTDERFYALRDFFDLAVNTGMRANEVLNLSFSEIDFRARQVLLPPTRTKEAREKSVPLNAAAYAVVEKARGDRTGSGLIFPANAKYQRIADLWREVCRAAGVRDLHIHDLRHTFATRAVESGIFETVVCRILGHSKLRMTTHYMHPSVDAMRRAVEALPQICHTGTRESAVS